MPLDPNIILGIQQPQIANPMDLAIKGLTMRDLANRTQIQTQQLSDDQAMRSAYQKNTTIGPDGTPSVNAAGAMSDLASGGHAMAAMKMGQDLRQQQIAMQEQKMKTLSDQVQAGKNLISQVPTDSDTPMSQKQAAWTNMKTQGDKLGLPNNASLPDQYPGDSFVRNMQIHLLTAEEQLAQQNKAIDQQTERAKANASLAEAGLPTLPAPGGAPAGAGAGASPMAGGPTGSGGFSPPPKMRQKAMEDYNSAVAGSRQQPDAAQSLLNVQQGQKLHEIVSLAPGGDLNKLNNQQTKLAITELVKMAGGSAPTESELAQMTPDNYAQKYSGILQNITNKPQPANAGEFIKQGLDYAAGIQKLGAQKLAARANEFADRQRPYLGEQQYKMVKGQIADEFNNNSPKQGAGAADHGAAVRWALDPKNSKDPRAAIILQRNGMAQSKVVGN